jgi:cell wall-associated NlpC family hydrolase
MVRLRWTPALGACLVAASLGGCATVTGTGKGVARPEPASRADVGSPREGDAIAERALAFVGTPYRSGGDTPAGFDCSGLAHYVFGERGITLPRGVQELFAVGRPIRRQDVARGDLVFFATTDAGPSHVGIVVGSDAFVHAPSSGGRVRVEPLSGDYWRQRFVGARRVGGH